MNKIDKKYDVIIVGAGPAGLNCALHLSKTKKKILLIEKNELIGPKVCAGGLTNHDLTYLKPPKSLLEYKFKEITIHTPFDKSVVKLKDTFVYTINREKLGQWQLKKLKNSGVEIRINARVTEIKKNCIIINHSEKIKFKYLVGADGSASIVQNFLKLENRIGLGIQYIIPTKKYKKIEMFLDSKLFNSWYAWIFPHKNYVSIGCGGDPRIISSKQLRDNFNKWLKKRKIDVSKGEYQAAPINYNYQGHKFKNIYLIGDAAGFASGLTGEGIYQALVSGEEIAKLIINKKKTTDKIEKLLKVKNQHNKILSYLEKSGKFREIEYELLALLLKSKFIDKKLLNLLT